MDLASWMHEWMNGMNGCIDGYIELLSVWIHSMNERIGVWMDMNEWIGVWIERINGCIDGYIELLDVWIHRMNE